MLASGDLSARATPDPIPNSAVKPGSADDTAGHTVGKVGHRQNYQKALLEMEVFFVFG